MSRARALRDVGGNARLELRCAVEESENADDVVARGLIEASRRNSVDDVAVEAHLDGAGSVIEDRVATATGGERANPGAANDDQAADVGRLRSAGGHRGRDRTRRALERGRNRRSYPGRRDDHVFDLGLP